MIAEISLTSICVRLSVGKKLADLFTCTFLEKREDQSRWASIILYIHARKDYRLVCTFIRILEIKLRPLKKQFTVTSLQVWVKE